ERGLNFVGDTQPAVPANDVVDDLEILLRRCHDPADALNRLADKTGDLAGRLEADQVFDVAGALDVAARVFEVVRATVPVARFRVFDVDRRIALDLPGPVRGQAHRRLRAAVVGVPQADPLVVVRELAGRQDGALVGLAAGVREVTDRQPAARR